MEMWRQGDLLFVKADSIPERAIQQKNNVILRGEATGHSHRLENGKIFRSLMWARSTTEIWIKVGEDGRVIHEEHKTLELPQGTYQIIRQREFNPFENRLVMD